MLSSNNFEIDRYNKTYCNENNKNIPSYSIDFFM